jgi:hypothetical protein
VEIGAIGLLQKDARLDRIDYAGETIDFGWVKQGTIALNEGGKKPEQNSGRRDFRLCQRCSWGPASGRVAGDELSNVLNHRGPQPRGHMSFTQLESYKKCVIPPKCALPVTPSSLRAQLCDINRK